MPRQPGIIGCRAVHDKPNDIFGRSVAHWEGDTLIVDAVGVNERLWIHRECFPHAGALHLIECISHADCDTLNYEITIDDRLAYDVPLPASWVEA